VRSLSEQTFGDFEALIYDDGSTDGTLQVLQQLADDDPRLRVFSRAHAGYMGLLAEGLSTARGELIARMDGDDISHPTRFERQVAHLDAHPECVAVGCRVRLIDPLDVPLGDSNHATDHASIEKTLLNGSGWGLVHPAVMMRKCAVQQVGGYRDEYEYCEDMDLFLRLAEVGRLANLPDVLLDYRQHLTSVNATKSKRQHEITPRIVEEALRRRGQHLPANWRPDLPRPRAPHDLAREWGWAALKQGRVREARTHARWVLRRTPFSYNAWRLMACALRGH
jgi:glycosyltransferase involved in cell wall biosynthesis